LVWLTAAWNAMTATLVGPAGAAAGAGAVCAEALSAKPAASVRTDAKIRFIGMQNSFRVPLFNPRFKQHRARVERSIHAILCSNFGQRHGNHKQRLQQEPTGL
jgi:hypothetical protein